MILRISTILAATGLVALGACAPTPGMDGMGTGTGMSRTQQGALAGAAVGAVLAGTRDSDKNNQGKDAARGAIIGGIAGAVAGNILDRQAQALQQSVSSNVQVVNRGDHLQVVLPEGILFATGSAAVTGQAQSDLYAVARNLNQYPNSRVQVVGHTDNTGSQAFNMDLSQRRAQSVASILTAAGVAPARLVATGQGMNQPVASNDTAQGRAQNRRVEILIFPTR
ncbi:OmpA family protein [Paracoccus shandongensis]|uniref:OmpA family protein n=1 Tax=Paracoccus shandongensis TaxID=2816048 RepID=UPI001A8ED234|nr:OmpA family protein [Paracoccus shandongensis]